MKPGSTVLIAGLGLIGGSLARALRGRGYLVSGVDPRPAALRAARRAGVLDRTARRIEDGLATADMVVLAAPPAANLALLRRVARFGRDGQVVTDVSSVKRHICEEAARLGLDFVGGHPMAGRERSGFEAAEADLFRGRPWILTAPASSRALRAARALVRAVGARPVVLSPSEHDRVVAFVSHLPQLVAWALWDAVRHDGVAGPRAGLAGPAYADMTRIAASPPGLWRQILAENGREIERALVAFLRALAAARRRTAPSVRRAS